MPPLATDSCPAQERFKVLLEIVPCMLVSLATNPTKVEPRVELLVPPLAMGKMPVTLVVRSMVELAIIALVTLRLPMAVTPVLPMVMSPETVVKVGIPLVLAIRIWAEVPTAASTGPAPLPYRTPLVIRVVEPVPPKPTGVVEAKDVAMVVVPEPLTAPLKVIVWLPVK